MSRVFEAMRRLNASSPETTTTDVSAEPLETFTLEAVSPGVDSDEEFLAAPAEVLPWLPPPPSPKSPAADVRHARERKSGERVAQSFSDLIDEIARDEQEHGL